MLRHLPADAYETRPWKNGQGLTDEVLLLPEGADRDAFDLRVSRASIGGRGLFSAFPGADRIITVIEGEGLVLEFDDGPVRLAPLAPYTFDSGRTPDGVPLGGGVRVFNVMAARAVWSLGPARVQAAGPDTTTSVLTVVLALAPGVRVGDLALAAGDSALAGPGTEVCGPALLVALSPAGGPG